MRRKRGEEREEKKERYEKKKIQVVHDRPQGHSKGIVKFGKLNKNITLNFFLNLFGLTIEQNIYLYTLCEQ